MSIGRHLKFAFVLQALIEFFAFLALLLVSVELYSFFAQQPFDHQGMWFWLPLSTLVNFFVLVAVGLYNVDGLFDLRGFGRRAATVIALGSAASLFILSFVSLLLEIRATPLFTTVVAATVLQIPHLFFIRWMMTRANRMSGWKKRVVVVGIGPLAEKIRQSVVNGKLPHVNLIGFVRAGYDDPEVASNEIFESLLISNPAELERFVEENNVDEIVIALKDQRGIKMHDLLKCRVRGIPIIDYVSFWEREVAQIDLDAVKASWFVYGEGFKLNFLRNAAQRSFDIVVSSALLIFLAPLLILTAIAIKLDSRGPLFYRQERVGQHDRTFDVLKFRSMKVDAEVEGKPQWAVSNDPRVTRIGSFIRKSRLDEVPQLLNVLKGDMSFVGPRPERPYFVQTLREQIPFYDLRHILRPGITGWAQVNYPYGASVEDARQKLAYDLYYAKNGSLLLDILILLQTIRVVIWFEGAR